MRRLRVLPAVTVLMLVSAAPSIADQEPYCTYPDFDPGQRSWHAVSLDSLVPDLCPDVDHDINLYVEQGLWDDYHAPGGIVDNYHLEQFIRGIWRSHTDNDIRTVWNYFAAHGPRVPDLPEYGQFGTNDYNFKYPELPEITHDNLTYVNVYLNACIYGGGSCSGNNITIDLAGQHTSVAGVPDWWYDGEWAGRTFVHEFQHTVRACFDQYETFSEGFCEAAVAVAGYSKIMVGNPHTDGTWLRYDLIYNNGLEEYRTYINYANQSECSLSHGNKYTGGFLWSAYIADQFPGADPNDITDDFLYQAIRATDGGYGEQGLRAFALAAANYSAWGYQNDPALFHEIFRRWTLANLLDGTSVDPTLTYPNHTVRIRYETDAGVGWLRDNEDPYCNDHPLPVHPGPDRGCGNWYPPTVVIPDLWQPQTYDTEAQESACSWDPYVGVELYAADYVGFVPGWSFPSGTILSLAFDVHDDDQNWESDNILMRCHAVTYGADENDPTAVEDIDMSQSDFPVYAGKLYHHIDGFGSDVSLVHTVVSAMEDVPLTSGQYPMRSYTITATAVPGTISVGGVLSQSARWASGQTVLVTDPTGLEVPAGIVLEIEPGVTVVFAAGSELRVGGMLLAKGNSALPVTFTSSNHSPGAWSRICTIGSSSFLDLEHCIIEYADKGVLVSYSGSHVIEDNTFRECNYGVYLDGVTLSEFRGNTFLDNTTGLYANGSRINEEYGFTDLYFEGNQTGITFEKPVGATILRSSTFERNQDCAVYFNQRKSLNGTFEMRDLTINGNQQACYAGIRSMGGSSQPKVRRCWIGDYTTTIGISCTVAGRVDAGTSSDHGLSMFTGNDCDIEYTILRPDNPPTLIAIGNCWDGPGGEASRCGNLWSLIITSEDCSGWGGPMAPPRPAEETVAGLVGVFPNPAEGSFRIAYGLGASERLKVQIYDLSGRLVRTVVESEMPAGTHEAEWDGTDAQGHAVGKGVYVCRIVGESFVESKRLVVMR